MSTQQPIVVDTNILFSALLSSQSSFVNLLLGSDYQFFVCEQVLVELFKRKEKLVKVGTGLLTGETMKPATGQDLIH